MRPALNPYPHQLSEDVVLKSGAQLHVRPIKGEDEPALSNFFEMFDAESLRLRFFYSRLKFEHLELAAMCQIDYRREMVFVAFDGDRMLGEMRLWLDVNRNELEFSIMVAPELQGEGLASILMQKSIDYGRTLQASKIVADVLPENTSMQKLAERFAFEVHPEEDLLRIERSLDE